MNYAKNYPSCIKAPNAKQAMVATNARSNDVTNILAINSELICLANRMFGEGKWSHSVTGQTLDFAESAMGKYAAGCAAFVRIQLQNGTFHEDMGYSNAEGTTKGIAVHNARAASIVDALKKVLLCFGGQVAQEVQKLENKNGNALANDIVRDDIQCSEFVITPSIDTFEPCAQSTPQALHKKTPDPPEKKPVQTMSENVLKKETDVKVIKQAPQVCLSEQNEQPQKRTLSEEELQRMERKRKQMEKQLEYKRLMKQKEIQKAVEKQNAKY